MKYTLLEMTQRILESMKADEVNSINDTAESLAVANIIKECYFGLISETDLPELFRPFELTASGDSAKPVLMYLPDDIVRVEWVKYDKRTNEETAPNFIDVKYLPYSDFMDYTYQRNLNEDNVLNMTLTLDNSDTIDFFYLNDHAPTFYTVVDDRKLIFDAFDDEVDDTLRKDKTSCWGLKSSVFTMSDSFTPELDAAQFHLLLQSAKATAWMELKTLQNVRAEKAERRQKVLLESKKYRTAGERSSFYWTNFPNYGRK